MKSRLIKSLSAKLNLDSSRTPEQENPYIAKTSITDIKALCHFEFMQIHSAKLKNQRMYETTAPDSYNQKCEINFD